MGENLHYSSPSTINEGQKENKDQGMPVGPGTYYGQLYKQENGQIKAMGDAQPFEVIPLHQNSIKNPMGDELQAYRLAYDRLKSSIFGF